MAYEIRAKFQMMRSSADEIEQNAESIRAEVEKVDQMLQALRQTFMGQSASKFFSQYDQAQETMQKWDDIVRAFADQLKADANALEQADAAGA